MPYYAYVLWNTKSEKYYKGSCSNLKIRLDEHRSGHTKTTRHEQEFWELIYFEEFEYHAQALDREKYFKTAAGRRYLKKVSSTDTRPNVPFCTGGGEWDLAP